MPTKAQLEQELKELRAKFEEQRKDGQESQEESDTQEEEENFLEQKEEALQDDIDAFLEEAGVPDTELIVDGYRTDEEGDGRIKYVHRWALQDFSLQKAKETFGGGKWSFRLKKAPNTHLRTKTVVIEGKPIAPSPDKSSKEDPRSFSEKVLDTQQMMLEKLQELRNPPPQTAGVDPVNMALSIVGAFDSILAPMREELREARSRKEGPDFGELVNIFREGMELGKIAGAPASDPMGQVLATTLPPLMDVITSGRGKAPSSPTDALTELGKTQEAETLTPKTNPPSSKPPWDYLVAPLLPHLLKWARKDADPDLRAAFVVDELNAETEALLLEQLKRGPDFFREFMLLHPEARPWERWLAEFWAAVADQFPWGEGNLGPHPFYPTGAPEQKEEPELGSLEAGDPPEEEEGSEGSKTELGSHFQGV